MPITPPSLPSVSLSENTYADDSSLALQAIAAEQSIAGLQKLGSSSEQLQALLARQQSVPQTIGQLQASRERLQQAEVNDTQTNLATISAIGDEPPENLDELQKFLADRDLPVDLSTKESREVAIAALTGYLADVQEHPEVVDNSAIRQRLSQDSGLQRTLRDANSILGSSDSYVRPADLNNLQTSLSNELLQLTQAVRDQVIQLVQGAQQVVVLTTDNAALGSQLVATANRGQQVAAARIEAAQRELQTQTTQLNQTVREIEGINLSDTSINLSKQLGPLVDQVKGSIQRLQAAVAILQPNSAITAARNTSAIDQRATLKTPQASYQVDPQADKNAKPVSERPQRLLDPNRLV